MSGAFQAYLVNDPAFFNLGNVNFTNQGTVVLSDFSALGLRARSPYRVEARLRLWTDDAHQLDVLGRRINPSPWGTALPSRHGCGFVTVHIRDRGGAGDFVASPASRARGTRGMDASLSPEARERQALASGLRCGSAIRHDQTAG
jgi:hypothetical protein